MSTLKERYEFLKSLAIGREGFDKLIKYLEEETEYLIAPASTRYHLCRREGLLEHSCNVAETMIKIKKSIDRDISDETCAILGLLHDCGKAGVRGRPMYIENEPTPRQKEYGYPATIPYSVNKNLIHMPHAIRSLYIVSTFMKITEKEAQAIASHDGQYIQDNHSYAFRESKEALLLHWADYYSTRFIEEGTERR